MRSYRGLLATLASALIVAACGRATPSPVPSPSASVPPPSPTPTRLVAPPSLAPATPTSASYLVISDLPRVDLADVDATAVCDPEPSQADAGAGESMISCADGLELALRALRAVTQDPVLRLYFQRPTCAQIPCSTDELSTARVTLGTATQAFSIQLDARSETVPQPSIANGPVWPATGLEPAPEVAEPLIEGAPDEVASGDAYPFCGTALVNDPPSVLGCFRDSVLAGRPAAMFQHLYGTEGDELLRLYRFDGGGPVVRYQRDGTAWRRSEGAMILGITPLTWNFDPWTDTQL